MSNGDRFQVELGGLIKLLSEHLYSSPGVFVRELLQNGVDAITARRALEPEHVGTVEFEVCEADGVTTIVFVDNGVGLTVEEMHQFLATIGRSSKTVDEFVAPSDFLGKFGVGLLSCFLVADEIVVVSQSARDTSEGAVKWTGRSNGTYVVQPVDDTISPGTRVYLRCRPDVDPDLVRRAHIRDLTKHYGEYLGVDVLFREHDVVEPLNERAPWTVDAEDDAARAALIEHASARFERPFQDVIPLRFERAGVEGHAFVLSSPVHSAAGQPHLVYLRGMLLADRVKMLMPDWAFFVQCIVNTTDLKPTASREALYEDDLLIETRQALGVSLRDYLVRLSRNDGDRFRDFLETHQVAVKALALEDEECLRIFADWLPFETSLGRMTLGEFRRENPVIRYVRTRDQFRQISPIAVSEGVSVVNAGYVHDAEILERLRIHDKDLEIEPFEMQSLADRFEAISKDEDAALAEFVEAANAALSEFDCTVRVVRFSPVDLPAVFVADANEGFARTLEDTAETGDSGWADVLGALKSVVESDGARLYLNLSNPVVQKVSSLADLVGSARCVELLYLHSLMLGHFPLRAKDVRLMNGGLLGVIDWALSRPAGSGTLNANTREEE